MATLYSPTKANFSSINGSQQYVAPRQPTNYTPSNANYSSAVTGGPAYAPQPSNALPASGPNSNFQSNPSNYQGGGDSQLQQYQKMESLNPVQQSEYEALLGQTRDLAGEQRNAINSGYDSYFSSLDSILNEGLPQQQSAQTGIVNSQYDQGVSQLGSQKNLELQGLNSQRAKTDTQQGKTLKDLADNIKNSFMAGNVYLGSKGAGDSSAANQYAYALTNLGSKQRGDINTQFQGIQNDINDREFRVNEIYNSEVNNLGFERDQQIQGIASWLAEQQNALKQAKAQGQLSRGQDLAGLSQNLLNVALQQLQNVQTQAQNKRTALEEWAMNNSQNVNQLKGNLAAIGQSPYAQAPNAQPLTGTPQVGANGSYNAPTGFGYSNEKDIFGRPIG